MVCPRLTARSGPRRTITPVRLLDAALPPRLGTSFRWLIAASSTNQFGAGLVVAAGPLLIASRTSDPFLIALAPMLQYLPLLLAGLGVGAYVDRVDRQRLIVVVNVVRATILLALAAAVVAAAAHIGLILTAVFLLGLAETFAALAGQTMLPSTVERADLGVAQPRQMATTIVGAKLVGPPVGALLFAAGMAVPFVANAVCLVAGAWLITRVTVRHVAEEDRSAAALRHDVAVGVRWLLANPPVRTLALTIVLFNVTWFAGWSLLVVWSRERLGLDAVGFGLLESVGAVGGVVAIGVFGPLSRRVSYAVIMRGPLSPKPWCS